MEAGQSKTLLYPPMRSRIKPRPPTRTNSPCREGGHLLLAAARFHCRGPIGHSDAATVSYLGPCAPRQGCGRAIGSRGRCKLPVRQQLPGPAPFRVHSPDTSGPPTCRPRSPIPASAMPLSRSLSMSSLPGLEDWEDEFDLENTVLFEVAWEVANKGEHARRRARTRRAVGDGGLNSRGMGLHGMTFG